MRKKVSFYYLKYVLFLITLYFFIFNPPFKALPLSPKFLLYLLIIPFFLQSKFHKYFGYFKGLFYTIIPIVLFSVIREIGSLKSEFLAINTTMFFEFLLIPIFIVILYESFTCNKDLILDVISVGFIATLFTIGMIFSPNLDNLIRYQLLRNDDFTEAVSLRTFGLGESLTFSYGIIQGLMIVLILFYSKSNKKLLLLIPIFLVCIMFNARVGFTSVIVGVIFYYIYNFKVTNIIATFTVLFGLFFIVTETSIFEAQKDTINWALDFFTQSSDFLSGNKSGDDNTFDTLFGDMFILPSSQEEWLVGKGINIFGRQYGASSDVGYIIQLYYGGIIYLILLFFILLTLFKYFKKLPKKEFLLGCSFLIIIILCNTKGNIFIPIGIMRLIFLITIYWFIKYKNNDLKIRQNG